MDFEVARVDIWAGQLEDRPGALASKLANIIMIAAANLEFIVARPARDRPGRGVLYLAPLSGPEQTRAAEESGLHRADSMYVVRLSGPDRSGLAAGIAGTLAQADLNIVGVSAAAVDGRVLMYLRFATEQEAVAAVDVLKAELGPTA